MLAFDGGENDCVPAPGIGIAFTYETISPLALTIVGLVGFALRERSAGYDPQCLAAMRVLLIAAGAGGENGGLIGEPLAPN